LREFLTLNPIKSNSDQLVSLLSHKESVQGEMVSFLRVTIKTVSDQLQGQNCPTFVKAVMSIAKGPNSDLAEPLLPLFVMQVKDPQTHQDFRQTAFDHMNNLLVALAPSLGS